MSLIKRVAQLHIQASSYDRIVYSPKPITSFRNVKQEGRSGREFAKPKGLWYACDKDWKRWVQREVPRWADDYNHKYLLDVNLNRMKVIRTEREMRIFHMGYSYKANPQFDLVPNAIDWSEVARDYDGIEICPYQYKFRMDYSWYYPWDVASGCIWGRGAFKGVTELDNDIHDGEFKSSDDLDDEEW